MGARTGMAGQGGEALELALGLLRAPGLRAALRTRALPSGIGELLAIASGSSDSVREASARTGHPEAELVEASRFFIQQVLLAEGADAYRTLGVAPDAAHSVLREHHHLLMRWLHPDRSEGAQWDSALSTRVNQAWNHLRTPNARAAYDADHASRDLVPARPATATGAATAALAHPIARSPLPSPTPIPTGPIAVAFLTIACLALAWLALTRQDRLDALRDASHVSTRDVDLSARMAAPLPRVLAELDVLAPAPREAPVGAETEMRMEESEEVRPLVKLQETDDGRMAFEASADEGAATAVTRPATPPPVDADAAETAVAAVAAPAGNTEAVPDDPVRLFRDAEIALDSVTAWLASDRATEPFWLDLPISLEAAAIRHELRARHAPAAHSRMAVVQPNWTLASSTASVSGAYRLDGRRGTVETGVLSVQLARRGEHWRIASLHLDPAR